MAEMTLTEFLEARIAEDEAQGCRCDCFEGSARECDTAWRAECDAKRAIIAEYENTFWPDPGDRYAVEEATSAQTAALMVRHLAAPYASHPDFDPSWRTP